jgi:hypothetical protein
MVMSGLPDPGSFGAAFVEFMRVMSLAAEERESEVAVRLREHLGADPKGLPTTGVPNRHRLGSDVVHHPVAADSQPPSVR